MSISTGQLHINLLVIFVLTSFLQDISRCITNNLIWVFDRHYMKLVIVLSLIDLHHIIFQLYLSSLAGYRFEKSGISIHHYFSCVKVTVINTR